MTSQATRPVASSRDRKALLMRFPCGHSEPEALAVARLRTVSKRAVWVACQRCNVIALACAPRQSGRP